MTPRHLIEPGRLAGSALLRAQSDARLVDLTRAGNDRAFEAIVDRYRRPLLRYCSRILSDGRGEDALQQVFMNAYDALKGGARPMSLRSWLFAIAHNAALNLLRQRGSSHEQLEAHDGPAESADDALERRERFREVLVAVAALPPTQRDAIVLRELEGRGHEEIARELGVTGGAARQLISRARNGIREAAAAIVPFPVLMRLTDGAAQPVTSDRLAELTVAGGGLTIGKIVATAAVGGALVGGAVETENLMRERGDGSVAEAEEPRARADASQPREAESDDATTRDAEPTARGDRDDPASAEIGDATEQRSEGELDSDSDAEEDNSNSGPGGGDESGDDNSGPGSGDDDSSGPGGGDNDSSGPGSGDDPTSETDNSGPGSGGDDGLQLDSSGPGSGDDSVDSDSSGPGSGGDDSGDSDNSGSGSGSSGSGSGSSGSSGSG